MSTSMHDILAMALQSAKAVQQATQPESPITQVTTSPSQQAHRSVDSTEFEAVNVDATDTGIYSNDVITYDAPADQQTTTTAPKITVKDLNEKAVLVQVKRRMYAPYKRDNEASDDYGAGSVNKHLFKDGNNRVKRTISKFTAVYKYVKQNTVPWSTGVEMLANTHYFEFSSNLTQLIDDAEQAINDLVANWDAEVAADLSRIANINPQLADPSDYPSADEVRRRFGIEVRYMPVPAADGFDPRLGMSEKDKQSLQNQLDDAGANAGKHIIESMLDVMQKSVDKLRIPIGADQSVFRNSLVDNLVEVSDRMAKVDMTGDPQVAAAIKQLRSTAANLHQNRDSLRNVQQSRDNAVQSIDTLMQTMQGLV